MGKGKKKYLTKRGYSLLIIFFSLLSCLFDSCSIFFISQEKIDELTKKFDNNLLQKNEKNEIKSIYKDMIWGGKFISPEASKILKYYISDHTDDLYINSEYFYKSEYIKKILKENENKEIIGPVYLKINKIVRRRGSDCVQNCLTCAGCGVTAGDTRATLCVQLAQVLL